MAIVSFRGIPVLFATAASLLSVTSAQAQIAEAPFTTSILTAYVLHFGQSLNQAQQAWGTGPLFNFGLGDNGNGVSGNVTHAYSGGLLTNITINVNELRNQQNPFQNYNDPYARLYGVVQFTPAVNTPYTIGGAISMVLSGSAASNSSASGSVWLEQVGGPTLATFGSSFYRGSNVSIIGSIYDSAAPLSGSPSGTLLAGVTYRLGWDLSAASQINGDSSLYVNTFALDGPQYLSITFAPSPGAAALLGLGGLAVTRRRRERTD